MRMILKIAGWLFAALLVAFLGIFGLQYVASERVEVVELHTTDPAGETVTTRLWVVDHEGTPYLRVGGDGSGWYSRLTENVEIRMTRGGETKTYKAVPEPDKSAAINDLMQAKYTWGESVIAALIPGSREGSIPIALRLVVADADSQEVSS